MKISIIRSKVMYMEAIISKLPHQALKRLLYLEVLLVYLAEIPIK